MLWTILVGNQGALDQAKNDSSQTAIPHGSNDAMGGEKQNDTSQWLEKKQNHPRTSSDYGLGTVAWPEGRGNMFASTLLFSKNKFQNSWAGDARKNKNARSFSFCVFIFAIPITCCIIQPFAQEHVCIHTTLRINSISIKICSKAFQLSMVEKENTPNWHGQWHLSPAELNSSTVLLKNKTKKSWKPNRHMVGPTFWPMSQPNTA